MIRVQWLPAIFAVLALTASISAAAEPVQKQNTNTLWFENWTGLSRATLTVMAPNGEVKTEYFETGAPVFRLSGWVREDGVYRYELTAATDERVKTATGDDRGTGDGWTLKRYVRNGAFRMVNGAIVPLEDESFD